MAKYKLTDTKGTLIQLERKSEARELFLALVAAMTANAITKGQEQETITFWQGKKILRQFSIGKCIVNEYK
jgi:hypothetical protein